MIKPNPFLPQVKSSDPCPCGSNKVFSICCAPYLKGTKRAQTAKALMRSRYTANVVKDGDYLARSWHPSTRPNDLDLSTDTTQWTELKILNTKRGKMTDKKGWVSFAASYTDETGQAGVLKEESMFVREAGQWYYHSGTFLE